MPIQKVGGGNVFEFIPDMKCIPADSPPSWSVEDYSNEPMVYSADIPFAMSNGGPITRWVLHQIFSHTDARLHHDAHPNLHMVVDTRVHMLMPGMIPAIGGWHCDAVPRTGGPYGDQPDPNDCDPNFMHYCMTVSTAETSRTEFVASPITVNIPPGVMVWQQVHHEVNQSRPVTIQAPHRHIMRFDSGTVHRAVPSVDSGWRFFLRLSVYNSIPRNEIRKQVQVYIPHEGMGW
jgi:hypothetical protein